MKINNKELIQSYILTTAKYDYSVYEKRILYRIVEQLQLLIEGKTLNKNYSMQEIPHEDIKLFKFTFPFSAFKKNEEDKNHAQIKKALLSLEKKGFEYEDSEVWETINILYLPKVFKNKEYIGFTLREEIIQAFLDFSKGFKKYELKTAMEFESVYSMRFYELLSNQKTPINYSIDTLKEMFQIENKYKLTADFLRYVIEPAKKELDKCSPYTFHYETIKTGRKITGIRFIPIHQPQFEDESLKKQKALKQMSNRWYIPKNIEDYLKYNYEFTNKELNNNLSLFESLHNHLSEEELLDFLVELKAQSVLYEIKNLKAYLIGSLKHKAEQIFEQKHMKK
ncbi:RepB family plasmid replication initiator protein [Apibacter muscae]|uniref:RepB family plasmid replication initiator protein n=2 Tax=Weeksellaceae TaxID=2762318 RepID=A0A563DAW9_9FLAO|nr:replication initiation protein [Apibacter muscae]TWP27365.1 RepB family plasmid replication initiator protein [Apibacter muscae]